MSGVSIVLDEVHRDMFSGMPESHFTISLNVSLFSDGSVTKSQLADYLNRALCLGIDYPSEGTGPEDSLVLISATITPATIKDNPRG